MSVLCYHHTAYLLDFEYGISLAVVIAMVSYTYVVIYLVLIKSGQKSRIF